MDKEVKRVYKIGELTADVGDLAIKGMGFDRFSVQLNGKEIKVTKLELFLGVGEVPIVEITTLLV